MSKEGEGALQYGLFTSQPLESKSPESSEASPTAISDEGIKENGDFHPPTGQSVISEREAPAPTFREVRALRSLLYNRLLLEIVQRRIEKGAATILSYLLTQEGLSAQIGPCFVWLDEDNNIEALRTLSDDDGWQQIRIPEVDAFSELTFEVPEDVADFQLRM